LCSQFTSWDVQVQLIRIELRVPEYGWTTQKVFHLLNFIVNGGKLSGNHLHYTLSVLSFCKDFLMINFICHCIFCDSSRDSLCHELPMNLKWLLTIGAVRAAVFCFRKDVQGLSPDVCHLKPSTAQSTTPFWGRF
jgi:hypothetical protein